MRIVFCILLIICCGFPIALLGQKKEIVVVIDPGHGGHDPGHLSHSAAFATEKELNLKISLLLGGYIEKYLQNVRVIYTRNSDVYPNLDDRVQKANSINADYFISIHCNGNERKSVRGTESHVHELSLTKSVALAKEIEKQFSTRAGRKSRGIKDNRDLQHSLQVLKYTHMPSVLVECGFVTNSREAAYLNSVYGQEILASAIFRAFRTTIVKEFPSISFIPSKDKQNTIAANNEKTYGIQIMSSIKPVSLDDYSFKKIKLPVIRKELNTSSAYKYIYTVGNYNTPQEAKLDLVKIQKSGFRDAIIIRH